jgi:NAD(P)H-dependent FMN reductase
MKKLRIIVSSTRPTRISADLAQSIAEHIPADWDVDLLDLAEINLPFLDEEGMPRTGQYALPHTQAWASSVAESDALVILTPEYNVSFPATIKNAIDVLYAEWEKKPIGLIGYGWRGGEGATNGLAPVLTHVKADVRGVLNLTFNDDLTPAGEIVGEDVPARVDELVAALV